MNHPTAVRTGFAHLDRMTNGLQRSDLVCIASRPSMGKTALALNIATNCVLSPKPRPVLFISPEMSKSQIMLRMIAAEARVSLNDARTGSWRRERWADLMNAAARIAEAPIYISDKTNLRVRDICAIARKLTAELKLKNKELDLIIIDDLQLLSESGPRGGVAEISRSLKKLACELNIPVVVLSQISRPERGSEHMGVRPTLSHLPDGTLILTADLIAFLHREVLIKPNGQDAESKAELIVAKNVRGKTGTAVLQFVREYARFAS